MVIGPRKPKGFRKNTYGSERCIEEVNEPRKPEE